MMHTASEKLAIISLVEDSELSVSRTLDEIKANEQVIEAYLGTGLKNKDQLEQA